jgi:Uma2 family endonuclease
MIHIDEAPMNVQLPVHLDKPTFLSWVQGREERYELVGGRVVMMPGVSRDHGMIVGNLYVELRRQLDRTKWSVIAEFGLDSGPETLRYPDVVVDRADGPGKDHTAVEPALLAEVLSPSTTAVDLGDKAAEYLQIPSLVAYLVLSQDEPKAWLWLRRDGQFSPGAEIANGIDAILRIPRLGSQLPLAEIYSGIKFT